MKQVYALILLCIFALVASSCKKEDNAGEVQIRVKNASSHRFESVYVNTSGGEEDYGSLSAGKNSDYARFTTAYRYAYIKVRVKGQELVLHPIDYVGEVPLAPGKYTYVVEVADLAAGRLNVTLE
ncbi:hypothetical protein [Hymenobacter pini]|uniref:hypothetical protein n=1 Tax=Hymenobacter pini TaxID=2880879 RepID=UPI001CF19C15|nr:hypothetical protein [Hymenobacter pini]MCA8831248.1 hypothetical protein [Hymenobacter pini]